MSDCTKETENCKFLEKLNRKIIKEMKDVDKSEKGQVRIRIDDKNDLFEVNLPNSFFEIILGEKEVKIFTDENSKSYIIADQPNIRIMYRKKFVCITKKDGVVYVVTDRNIKLDEMMKNIIKEKDVISFYNEELVGIVSEFDCLKVNYTDEAKDRALIKSNDTLLISEEEEKVFLPYTAEDLERELQENENTTVAELIQTKHIIPLKNYKNAMKSRFKEAFNLMRYKENKSFTEALLLGIELMFESSLHPAIISACKNLQELDIYLDCLDDNELEKFSCFKIVYKAMPMLMKKNNLDFFKQEQ